MNNQNRSINVSGNVTGSILNVGDVANSTLKSVASLPAAGDDVAAKARPLLDQLVKLLEEANAKGVPQETAVEAMAEVKQLAETVKKPVEEQVVGTVKKTLRTLKGFAEEFAKFPAIAMQYQDLVGKISGLF